MENDIPRSKWKRGWTGGKTAARMGGKMLKYIGKKPFLSEAGRLREKEQMEKESAAILFHGLSLLKGTALKIAQTLSMELDLLPSQVRRELEKSYNQVPPINRALIRKIMQNAFGRPPEAVFQSYDPSAFAAASLGQVHRAWDHAGRPLAVKIQYPGIRSTIINDVQLMKSLLRPLAEYDMIVTALQEIEARLLEEIDYHQEAAHTDFFRQELQSDQIRIPEVYSQLSTDTILTTEYLPGLPLNEWMKTETDQNRRDMVAQTLQDVLMQSLYELNYIHADPNPGNFIIDDDLRIGIIDFGCVKKLEKSFVADYQKLVSVVAAGDRATYLHLLKAMGVLKTVTDKAAEEAMYELIYQAGQWFSQLYEKEQFDFRENPNFFQEGRELSKQFYQFRRYAEVNPHFIFLDRTRYGLLRIFEQLGARVRFRNGYEWES